MSRRKAEPAVPKSHGQGRSAGAAWTVSRICWRNPAFSLTACRDGGSERRTQQDASIFRHDGLRGHASREARCGVHSQGLAQNGGTKRATRSMATRQAQWCLAARSRVRPRTRTGGRQQWSVVIAAKSTRSRSRHLRQNVTARAPSGGEEVCRRLVRGMSLLTRRADAPQRTAAVRRGKATHTGRGTLTTARGQAHFHTACARGATRQRHAGTVASGSAAVGSRPDTVMRGRCAGQREVARQPSTDVWARPRHATCRFASGARTPGRRRRGEHMDAAAVRQGAPGISLCSRAALGRQRHAAHFTARTKRMCTRTVAKADTGSGLAKEDACVLCWGAKAHGAGIA
ncbi:hypothetical protein ERJ75_001379500 [Trypanosoma vivax]|nr:hypothetical protein ERJ75_001379500 [Trypanosoma vivax]